MKSSQPPKEEPYAYVRKFYGVDPVIGSRVAMKDSGQSGIVVRKRSYDQYVHVRFDGRNFDVPVHPLDLVYPKLEAAQ